MSFDVHYLDCFEFGPERGIAWSRDNHIVILGQQTVMLVTPQLPGSTIKRAKWTMSSAPTSATFSSVKIDGHYRLAILDTTGTITIYSPRLDPTVNAWTVIGEIDVVAQCFDWYLDSIVYGTTDGRIVKENLTIMSRVNRIPTALHSDENFAIVGWDDGLIVKLDLETGSVITLCSDDCWGVGPIISEKLFAKVNRVYINGVCNELCTLSPIVGLSSSLALTRDGQIFTIPSTDPHQLPIRFERIYGAAVHEEYMAVTGVSKGKPILLIMPKSHL